MRDAAETIERRILLTEIVAQMDDWTRQVFKMLVLDYSYSDIAARLGGKPKAIRTRFERHLERIQKRLRGD
jgi:DNA-directed RNA polymerase specialized sigma24 family protein